MIVPPETTEARQATGLQTIFRNYELKILIKFEYGNTTANAKSVLSVLGACVKCGDEIELICEGVDEKEALDAITELINGGLGE